MNTTDQPNRIDKTTGPADLHGILGPGQTPEQARPVPLLSINPINLYTGFSLAVTTARHGEMPVTHVVNIRVSDRERGLRISSEDNVILTAETPYEYPASSHPSAELAEQQTGQCKYLHHLGAAIVEETNRLFGTMDKMIQARILYIQDKYKRDIPDPVIKTCLNLGLYLIERLEYSPANGCFYVVRDGLFIGIEEDGYAHS